MADERGLRRIGMAYGAFAAMVALIAVLVVASHVSGQLTLEGAATDLSSLAR